MTQFIKILFLFGMRLMLNNHIIFVRKFRIFLPEKIIFCKLLLISTIFFLFLLSSSKILSLTKRQQLISKLIFIANKKKEEFFYSLQ